MELEKRSRVWIVTFFQLHKITVEQLPDHPGGLLAHAIQSDATGSCSVFIKFKTLTSSATILKLYNDYDKLVIKRSSWSHYDEFKLIHKSSETIIHGPEKYDDSDQDQPLNRQQCNHSSGADDSTEAGYATDDFIADVKRLRAIKRSIANLRGQLVVLNKKIKV